MTTRAPKLLLGVGNVLCRDEGVGVEVARFFMGLRLPADVQAVDAGTAGLDAAGLLERRERVVVVDGIEADAEPGAVFRLDADQLRPYVQTGMSLHDNHLLHALDETRLLGTQPRDVVVIAVQVADVSVGIGLSPPVAAAFEQVVRQAAQALGLPPRWVDPAIADATPALAGKPKGGAPWH